MISVSGDWISSKAARAVCDAITDAGHNVFFVGGCVRNDLLGVPISDLDLSTDARPEQVTKAAELAGLRVVPTGIDHGTVTVIVFGEGLEVTTFRKDVATDGRRAVVAFSNCMEDDARRRDFTMNALYATPNGDVVDPLEGLTDLKARRVRFIDNADERIREDYLRALRFFRFHAWYGDQSAGIDPDGLAAIAVNLDGLETLSGERVGSEMLKLLAAPDPAPSVASMMQVGVLTTVLPGADAKDLPALVHLEQGRAPNAIRRLAALGGEDVAKRLRMSKHDRTRLDMLRKEMGTATRASELAYRLGAEVAGDVVLLRAAQMGTEIDPKDWSEIETGAAATFPIKPTDLMPTFIGPDLGDELRRLEGQWIASSFMLSREDLLA